MWKADLTAAGISHADDAARVADSHSLRTTFSSHLLKPGVDIRPAKALKRHPAITMTDEYALTLRGAGAEPPAAYPTGQPAIRKPPGPPGLTVILGAWK